VEVTDSPLDLGFPTHPTPDKVFLLITFTLKACSLLGGSTETKQMDRMGLGSIEKTASALLLRVKSSFLV